MTRPIRTSLFALALLATPLHAQDAAAPGDIVVNMRGVEIADVTM